MKKITLIILLTAGFLSAAFPQEAQQADLVLPSMLIESGAGEGPELKELKSQEWESSLPDAAFTLPSPPPLTNPELDSLFESPASLLPSGSLALPPDWNLLTSLGITLGAPYHFGAEASLIRLGKTLPFQLDFSHRTLDSYWNGQGLQSPGSGFSHRSTAMAFQASGDPSKSWTMEMSLREDSTGLQQKVSGFHSAEFRKARLAGDALLRLDQSWALAAGIEGSYSQKVFAGPLPSGAALGEAALTPGILWNTGPIGKVRLDFRGGLKNLDSDVQPDSFSPSGEASLRWELYPFQGWTWEGRTAARLEESLWLFPARTAVSLISGRWSGRLEGGFDHGPAWDLWEGDTWGTLEISREPEASGWIRGNLRWDWSAQGWVSLGGEYRGGWKSSGAAPEPSSVLWARVPLEGSRIGGTAEAWYRLGNLWNNRLALTGRSGLLEREEAPVRIQWTTELEPAEGFGKISHSLVWRRRPEGEIPKADLMMVLSPSPLFSLTAGAEDWTSLFLEKGRLVPGTEFLEPGFKIYLSGKLNI